MTVVPVFPRLEALLPLVSKPVQYVGGELNAVVKPWDSVAVHWALMYPDAYEVGVPNQGGSLTTRGGLTFIGATQERAFRAFDTKSGALLWKTSLPAGGNAAPMSYTSPKTGRQYIVISAGGIASLQSGSADYVMAYALPAKGKTNGN